MRGALAPLFKIPLILPLQKGEASVWCVIANEAKQSHTIAVRDCFVAAFLAMTRWVGDEGDGVEGKTTC